MIMLKVKKNLLLFTFLILSFTFSSYAADESQDDFFETENTFFLQEDVVFHYNSTSNKQTLLIEIPFIELDVFNKITIFFAITGSTTDTNGLKITFNINNTALDFVIITYFQDGGEYNLTKAFEYTNSYSGPLNITITCEGKAYSGYSGFLRILSTSFIVPVEVHTLTKSKTNLVSIPDWLFFKGSIFSSVNESVKTVFYNTNENYKLNISLFFILNDISVYSKFLTLKLNGEIIRMEDFTTGNNLLNFHSIGLDVGLNVLECIFNIGNYFSFISISNILLSGYVYTLEDLLPIDIFKWVEWEGENLECSFNLNKLKPEADNLKQILNFHIYYGYIGTTFTSPITYEVLSGTNRLEAGQTKTDEQNGSIHSLQIKTWTTNYSDTLTLRISGQTEGEGVFYILNSSKIEIESLPTIKAGQLTRSIVDNLTVQVPLTRMIRLNFQDFINFAHSNSTEYSLDLIYTLKSIEGEPATSVRIYLEVGDEIVIDKTSFNPTSISIGGKLILLPGVHTVNLTLTIVGSSGLYSLQNLSYQVSVREPNIVDDHKPTISTSYLIVISIWGVISLILVGRKNRKNIQRYGVLDDSASNKVNKWIYSILQFLKLSFIFFPIIFSFLLAYYLPGFYPHVRNFLSFLLGYLVFKLVSKLERRKYNDGNRTRRIPSLRDLSVTNELSNSRNWFYSSSSIIGRSAIGASVILFFGVSTTIYSLFLAKINEIIYTNWHPSYLRLGQIGIYLMLITTILGILSCFYALRVAMNFPFVEDNLLKFLFAGAIPGLGLFASWILLYMFISNNVMVIGFRIYSTLVLPISLALTVFFSLGLGIIRARQYNILLSSFLLPSQEIKKKHNNYQKAIVDNRSFRFDYEPYHTDKHRDSLEEAITTKQLPASILLKKLAKLAGVPYDFARDPLTDLLIEKPELGTYYEDKDLFVPKSAQETVIKSEFDSITARVNEARKIAARDEASVVFEEDINEEETNLEMKKTVKEHFQELYNAITGENEDEKRGYLFEEHELTPKETITYLNFLKRGIGDKDVIFTSADREFLQRAWKKIHVKKDIFQRNNSKNLMKDFYDRISSGHNGFDDVVFRKIKNHYKISFIEIKTGDPAVSYPWYYTPKNGYHVKRRNLNKKQLIELLSTKEIRESSIKFLENDGEEISSSSFFKKLQNDRLRNYYAIGNDWIIKLQNGDFLSALNHLVKNNLITKTDYEKIISGTYKFNQLLGLAQNGHTFLLEDFKKIKKIVDHLPLEVNNQKISISYRFFLPKIEKKGKRIFLSLVGFNENKEMVYKKINRLIERIEIKSNLSEDQFLILYTKMKRKLLSKFLNNRICDDFKILKGNKCYYGLDTLISKDYTSKSKNALVNQPENNRGVSWFYNHIQFSSLNFLKYNDLMRIIEEEKDETLYEKLVNLLIDANSFFERESDFKLSMEIFQENPFDLFLFNSDEKEYLIPPTFSFRKAKCPKAGIILIDRNNRIVKVTSPSKMTVLQLESDDILLNFPFRWDSHYGYFAFTQKNNKSSIIAKSWIEWLVNSNLPIPSGPSGRIPHISLIVILLEWWKRQENFVLKKIFRDSIFVNNCKNKGLRIDKKAGLILDKNGDSYKLAKVSVSPEGWVRHKAKWKLMCFFNEKLKVLIETIKAAVFDITILEKANEETRITDLPNWLKQNWLDELAVIKKYLF